MGADWKNQRKPPLFVGGTRLTHLEALGPVAYGRLSGYFFKKNEVVFVAFEEDYPQWDFDKQCYFVAGAFNRWAVDDAWSLQLSTLDGKRCLMLSVPQKLCLSVQPSLFKFVSGVGAWFEPPQFAPNRCLDAGGNWNFELSNVRTGRSMFRFETELKSWHERLYWKTPTVTESIAIDYKNLLLKHVSSRRLGAVVEGNRTTFSLFAPRANRVTVTFFKNGEQRALTLDKGVDGVWSAVFGENLAGYFYFYSVKGDNIDAFCAFDEKRALLDPYALAVNEGYGVIMETPKCEFAKFTPPAWHDLILLEGHVRDLVAHAPIALSEEEQKGFAGLKKWVDAKGSYLRELGINAVELLPLHECGSHGEYAWGYMPISYFAPSGDYAQSPNAAIRECQELVECFHKNNLAVILDVVYNHVGDPNSLLPIDKLYYFECNEKGDLMNHSGCGNDFRCSAPMAKRLILDSLKYWVETFNVDGFRFDLAELIGMDVLKEIERELKSIKPDIILIAEPWSFRGHIAHALKETGFAFWNDGYRNFLAQYVCGEGNLEGIQYYLDGSLSYLTRFPAQTVNYTESHDDLCWLDKITENTHHNGTFPTEHDRRRTHLMCALLMSSLGIPMLAAGQDFLRSKSGNNNTYQRGDLNALPYWRQTVYSGTYDYFRHWIAFRKSHAGRLFRLDNRHSEHYLRFFNVPGSSSIAALYNADFSAGNDQLLLVVNPHKWPVRFTLDLNAQDFVQIADTERFCLDGVSSATLPWTQGNLDLQPLCCALYRKIG
ncbi:MAG: hypothetical protein A2Y14_04060 [Verrucomicrobia bacterium GWF2_51_19]|nr:MAG: hypothetical protein A2Y14_04060 [Verrucomicrobia bacterium GWF2_51_19]